MLLILYWNVFVVYMLEGKKMLWEVFRRLSVPCKIQIIYFPFFIFKLEELNKICDHSLSTNILEEEDKTNNPDWSYICISSQKSSNIKNKRLNMIRRKCSGLDSKFDARYFYIIPQKIYISKVKNDFTF